ncbi:MAG: GTP-binding protein [Myxococcales bacterium]|jgi:signal recognition particle receptor subunit beta
MSVINQSAREITAKIVFYGPGLSGKTTSLRRIYETIRPTHRGEMVSLATEGDRTLFFDFLPVKVERVGNSAVRLALYTVPGQVFYNATRKLVLQGVDGVVFVADSQPAAMDSNLESFENLCDNLRDMGLAPEQIPIVFQYNKRDLPGVLPVEQLRARLNPRGLPDFETVAAKGKGVLDVLRAITKAVIRSLKAKGVFPSAAPRPAAVPALLKREEPSLASQLEQVAGSALLPPAPAPAPAPEPAKMVAPDPSLLTALVPEKWAGEASLAEAAYRTGSYKLSFAHALAGLRGLTSTMGIEGMSEVELALMAGLTGPDYSRLLRLEKQPALSREEAAFGLLMFALVGARMRR